MKETMLYMDSKYRQKQFEFCKSRDIKNFHFQTCFNDICILQDNKHWQKNRFTKLHMHAKPSSCRVIIWM